MLQRFGRNLTSVEVDGQEVNGVVLGIEWGFRVFAVVGVVVDAPQNESFLQRPEEQVLVRVRQGTLWNGAGLAVHESYRILGCPFFQGFYVSHLNSRTLHILACEQHYVHYLHLVVGVLTTGHQREGVFATYEPYLDTDTVEKKSFLKEEVDMSPPHHLDDSTLRYVPSSFNQTCIATIHGLGIHVSGGVLVP